MMVNLPSKRSWLFVGLLVCIQHQLAANPADDFFKSPPAHRIKIELSPEALNSLKKSAREDVRARVQVAAAAYEEVAIHLKGSVGSFRPIDQKPSFTLDFNKNKPDQKLFGLSKIHLNNSLEDPSFLNEQLGAELFRAAGIPAPRVTHALVELNGRALGLYVLKEGFAEEFLSNYFQAPFGNLYDTYDGHDIDQPLQLHVNKSAKNQKQDHRKKLFAACQSTNLDERWERLSRLLDIDKFVRFMVMEVMIGHRDGYCLARNNFRIYHDPHSDKMIFLPSGMDQLFGNPKLIWNPHMAGIVAKAVIETGPGKNLYRTAFTNLFSTLMDGSKLTNRVAQLAQELRPFLSRSEFREIEAASAEFSRNIVARIASLEEQLKQPEPSLLVFQNGIAHLKDWEPVNQESATALTWDKHEDKLKIVAGPKTSASWRARVLLPAGRYLFEGIAQTTGVKALTFGKHHGAALRVGDTISERLLGSSPATALNVEFDLKEPAQIELICELRASDGEAEFALKSLQLKMLRSLNN
jgi:spore coat protein H